MLFGHQNDDTDQPAQTAPVSDDAGLNPLAVDPVTGASLPTAPQPPTPTDLEASSVLNQPTDQSTDTSAPATPVTDYMSSSTTVEPQQTEFTDTPAPTPTDPMPTPIDEPTPSPASTDDRTTAPADDSLLALKQQALAQLSPLVGQLDQTPEEKFRTTMMMIQSTDNQALIQDAYDAAQGITDEKVRAQALLDVINEINYFTQQKSAE